MNKYSKHIPKCFYSTVLAFLTISSISCAQQQEVAPAQQTVKTQAGRNAIKNGSFEEGTVGWDIPANSAKVVEGVGHIGTHSLHYQNADPKKYLLFTQVIDAQPGQNIRYSAWIKGKDVKKEGSTAGASIFMESVNGSTYLGGDYPSSKSGTFDWTQVTSRYTVPLNATKTIVGVYFRPGVTGEAWFDDVEVIAEAIAPFKSTLLSPNYRGIVKNGDNTPWKFGLQINKAPDWKANPIEVTNTLIDSSGKVLLETTQNIEKSAKNEEIALQPPSGLLAGKYTLRQSIVDPNGKSEEPFEYRIQVVEKMPRVYIDRQGFTVVDGKRFFPNGLYIGGSGEDNLKRIADGGFNTILAYAYGSGKSPEAYMERAQKYNLKVVYSLKDMYPGVGKKGEEAFDMAADYIRQVHDKPSLLGWYTNDEMGASWAEKLEKMYHQIQRLDTGQHPTFQVAMIGDLETAYRTGDVIGTDPYPVRGGGQALLQTSLNTRVSTQLANGAKGVWMVPQIFDWAVYNEGTEQVQPTLDEMRNQAYQALIGGATGLIWYSYFDLFYGKAPRDWAKMDMELFRQRWKDVSAMGREVDGITPIILKDQKVPLDLPEKAEVEAAAWQDGNELLIMLANPHYQEKSIAFALPRGWKIQDVTQGQIKSAFAKGKTTFTLPAVGSGVFRLTKK